MPAPVLNLPPAFDHAYGKFLSARGIEIKQVARSVRELSDYYLQNPGARTPWDKSYCKTAYLNYFLPLNTARLQPVMNEVARFLPQASVSEVWDFGAGLGAAQWALEALPGWDSRPLYALEADRSAVELYRELIPVLGGSWPVQFVQRAEPRPGALAVFSYSFLEMQNSVPDLNAFEHLLIVEPSTQERGRALMETRDRLMKSGLHPLAPCTHAHACPLLANSARDWCHMRMHFQAPAWFQELEEHLPMKNRTLTYSYLLMSRSIQDHEWRDSARAIGDTLVENGKTKQMICRGPKREFVSWLHRFGPPPEIPHGALIRGVEKAELNNDDKQLIVMTKMDGHKTRVKTHELSGEILPDELS